MFGIMGSKVEGRKRPKWSIWPLSSSNPKMKERLSYFRTEEWAIKQFFERVGKVAAARIAMNDEGRPKGFAHIEFANAADAAKRKVTKKLDYEGPPKRAPRLRGPRGGP